MTKTPATPLRAAVYARQSEDVDQGIHQQLDDCREEARRRDWTVVAQYADNDVSGSKQRGETTDWHKMLRAYDDGAFDALIVTESSRLTRRIVDVLDVVPPRRDIRVIAIRESVDTLYDDTFLKISVVFAEREVRQKAARARRYALERRKAGHPTSGRTPYGYHWVHAPDRDAQGTRFRIDDSEAQIIRRVFDEFLAGATLGQIASDLNADGFRTRKGARWHSPTIRRLLINPHLAALLPPVQPEGQNDMAKIDISECTPGAWPAIVEVEKLLAARGRLIGVKPVHSGTARKWLLSGLAVCGVCGGPVRSARAATHPSPRVDGSGKAPTKYHAVYRCVAGHFVRKGEMIDEFIKEVCIERLSRPDARDLLTQKNEGPDLGVLSTRRAELQSRDETLTTLFVKGRISKAALDTGLDELSLELRDVNEQIAALVHADPLADALSGGDARSWWESETTTLARRRAVVETLMTVIIHRVGTGRRVTSLEAAAETITIEWKQPTAGSEG